MRLPDAEVTKRRAEAKGLRAQGWSYREIAARMGICHQAAHEMVNDAVRERANARRRRYMQEPDRAAANAERLRERRRVNAASE